MGRGNDTCSEKMKELLGLRNYQLGWRLLYIFSSIFLENEFVVLHSIASLLREWKVLFDAEPLFIFLHHRHPTHALVL